MSLLESVDSFNNTAEVISWAMHKLRVEEWLVSVVMYMYTSAKKQLSEQFIVIAKVSR